MLTDVLHDVRLDFGDGAALKAPSVQLSRGLFGPRSLRAPNAHLSLRGDPLAASSLVRRLVAASPPELDIAEVAVDYRHRSLGHLALEGVERPTGESSFVAKRLVLGGVSWSAVPFSFETRPRALEVRLGAAGNSEPRATATYMVSDGRAAEWILEVPYQSFAALGRALGVNSGSNDDPSRITGTFSWIVPDDRSLTPSGTFHFVIDRWREPNWPEASALTGSSGSLGGAIVVALDGRSFRLERVEVAAAAFALTGSGTITITERPELRLHARGRRTCAELARDLPPSRYRDTVLATLGLTDERPATAATKPRPANGADAGSVELELTIELSLAARGSADFRWHLTPGCGLGELSSNAGEPIVEARSP
ncbi:MAG TPA: hypothetical protein VFZ53_22975 [Polyangiaceae bacterium]